MLVKRAPDSIQHRSSFHYGMLTEMLISAYLNTRVHKFWIWIIQELILLQNSYFSTFLATRANWKNVILKWTYLIRCIVFDYFSAIHVMLYIIYAFIQIGLEIKTVNSNIVHIVAAYLCTCFQIPGSFRLTSVKIIAPQMCRIDVDPWCLLSGLQ